MRAAGRRARTRVMYMQCTYFNGRPREKHRAHFVNRISLQGRVTDHRVGHTEHNIERVLAGESLDVFVDALRTHAMNEQLQNLAAEKFS